MRSVVVAVILAAAACGGAETLGPEGSSVTLRGRVSDTPKQALEQGIPGKIAAHFDHASGKTVIYWVSAPACPGDIEVTGTVKIESAPAKAGDSTYMEKVIDVRAAGCVE